MTVKEVATLTGVTVRTLHYYDQIGLLPPASTTTAGYRQYDQATLARLQQILFFRELNFPLSEIKAILTAPGFDTDEALRCHRNLLHKQRARLDDLIALVNETLKGEITMNFHAFDTTVLDEAKAAYAAEAKARWGDTDAYRESERRTASYGPADWSGISQQQEELFAAFAALRQTDPRAPAAQELVCSWQDHITARFYPCTKEILASLGEMYVADERFTASLDRHGVGTAQFMSQAIAHFCQD